MLHSAAARVGVIHIPNPNHCEITQLKNTYKVCINEGRLRKTETYVEEGFIQKRRQRSSLLFGGQNLLDHVHVLA